MAATSAIEWTNATWNPTTGCDRVSPGCDHCYALTMAGRLKLMGSAKYQADGDPRTSGPGFGVAVHPDALDQPLRWQRPRRIFVNSMSDLFHKDIPDDFIAQVFAVMGAAQQHTFQVLTKRHARMRSLLSSVPFRLAVMGSAREHRADRMTPMWPLRNVWLGVSAEDQRWADIRIPALLDTPAAVRFISAEPLLGPIDLGWCGGVNALERDWFGGPAGGTGAPHPLADWVIIGGESGPGARRMEADWARDLVAQCRSADVAPFVKQLGAVLGAETGSGSHGADWDAWPEDLRVREFPRVVQAVT